MKAAHAGWLCCLVVLGYPGVAHADAFYKLVNRHSGKCLDVQYDSRDNGAALVQYDCHSGWNQQWSMRPTGDGFVRIIGRNSNRVLDVWGLSVSDGAEVKQYDYWGGWNQQWYLEPLSSGHFKIVSRNSNKALEIYGITYNNGAPAVQWTYWGGWNQQWQLVRAGMDCDRDTCDPCLPGSGEVCVRGKLEYRECMPSSAGGDCSSASKPIRRARVEVWRSGGLANVTESNNQGQFQAVIPAGGNVNVVVVTSGPAGQVNWRDNDATWYWKDLNDYRYGGGGSTLTYNWRAERDDARHFNALDVTLRGLEYALAQTYTPDEQADRVFHKISVIPRWAGTGGVTLPAGQASHIWVGWDEDIFNDSTLLHEYGHHLERMNGTYAAWPAFHNGCYATADLGICKGRAESYSCNMNDTQYDGACWANSPQYAWFEGFPTFYARIVASWDAGAVITAFHRGLFKPGVCNCPLVTSPHYNNGGARITPAAVEDYATNTLLDLWNSPSCAGSGADGAIFRTWWWDLSNRMPDVYQFRDVWNAQHPGSQCYNQILTGYGMMCAHGKCTTGAPLNSGCDPCVAQICAVDPYCCSTGWDAICVAEVQSVCHSSCP